MPSTRLITVDETNIGHAQVLRGLLESQGIRVWLNQESAGTAIGLNLPSILGSVQIIVNEQSAERARELIDAYYQGGLQGGDGEEPTGDGEEPTGDGEEPTGDGEEQSEENHG